MEEEGRVVETEGPASPTPTSQEGDSGSNALIMEEGMSVSIAEEVDMVEEEHMLTAGEGRNLVRVEGEDGQIIGVLMDDDGTGIMEDGTAVVVALDEEGGAVLLQQSQQEEEGGGDVVDGGGEGEEEDNTGDLMVEEGAEDMEVVEVYEEVIHEEEGTEEVLLEDDEEGMMLGEEDDKENNAAGTEESDLADTDFAEEDDNAIMEITRRRISQDREGNCYCGKDRNLNIVELLCASCSRWYHESCIGYQLGKLVPFMSNYVFMCKNCSPTGLESFRRSQAQCPQMIQTALANLAQACVKNGTNTKIFSQENIILWLEQHWDSLTTRRVPSSLHSTVMRALQQDIGKLYIMEETMENPGYPCYGLMSADLTGIKPNYEVMIRTGHLKVNDSSAAGAAALRGRGSKRRNVDGAMTTTSLSQGGIAKKTRGDVFSSKVFHGYPTDHPYNKDNYRYWLAEPDPNAPFRQEFDESSEGAGKPIPGFLLRVLIPNTVLLALHDRAPQLKISEDRLSVTGDKGYSMVRATHGVNRGSWYFEAKIIDLPEGAATRIGFGQSQANLQGPLGYDQFGYSCRSRYGTAFHVAKGKTFAKGGYGIGDVIGMMIILPDDDNNENPRIPDSFKDKPLVRFKSHLYYEEKDAVFEGPHKKEEIKVPVHKGSKIVGFKNGVYQGVAFEDLGKGTYYPTVSLYRSVVVRANFGPEPWVTPETDLPYKMMSEKAEQAIIEQTVADLVYLTENDGNLTLDNYIQPSV